VGVRINVRGVSMCFVNVHFTAHRENYAGRVMVTLVSSTFSVKLYDAIMPVSHRAYGLYGQVTVETVG